MSSLTVISGVSSSVGGEEGIEGGEKSSEGGAGISGTVVTGMVAVGSHVLKGGSVEVVPLGGIGVDAGSGVGVGWLHTPSGGIT